MSIYCIAVIGKAYYYLVQLLNKIFQPEVSFFLVIAIPIIVTILVIGVSNELFSGALESILKGEEDLHNTSKDNTKELEQHNKIENKVIIPASNISPPQLNQNNEINPIISIDNEHWKNLLREVLLAEIPKQINSIDSLKAEEVINNLKKKNPFMKRIGNKSPFDTLLPFTYRSENFGIMSLADEALLLNDKNEPIRITFPPIFSATSAVFFYLKYKKKYNLELDFAYFHALEIINKILKGDKKPDVCVVGDGPATALICKSKPPFYDLVSILPKIENRIIVSNTKDAVSKQLELDKGYYCFISDEVSTILLGFEDYIEQKKLPEYLEKSKLHINPDEALSILQSGDLEKRFILWSPHWQIFTRLRIAQSLETTGYWADSLLFCRRTFLQKQNKKARALKIAVRDACNALYDKTVLAEVIEIMLKDKDYPVTLKRSCGIHKVNLSQIIEENEKLINLLK